MGLKTGKRKRIDGLLPSTSVSILGKAVCGLSLITCDSFAVRALARFSLVRFVSIRGGGGCAPPSTVRGSPPQLFIDLQLASKHVITRVRGKRVPWTTSSSLPIAATIHARARVCVCLWWVRGGWLPGVGSQNTSVGFWRCGMLPSYLEYWIRRRKDCSSIRE